jgi:transposase
MVYYIGLDIAKRSHTALARIADRNVVWLDLSISNDRDGFEPLQQHLQ